MKKLVLFAVVAVAISFASCGGNKPTPEEIEKARMDSIAKADSIAKVKAETEAAALADSLKAKAIADSLEAAAAAAKK